MSEQRGGCSALTSAQRCSNWPRQRVERHGWQNVTLVRAAIEEAALDGQADGAPFSFTHDVLQSPAALDNVLGHLRPGARVVAVGASSPARWLVPLARRAVARYITTMTALDRPWALLVPRLEAAKIERAALGAIYIVSGATPAERSQRPARPVIATRAIRGRPPRRGRRIRRWWR